MSFQANKVKSAVINGVVKGYARNPREVDAICDSHAFDDVVLYDVAIDPDDSHNIILARCALNLARRGNDVEKIQEAEAGLVVAEVMAGPSFSDCRCSSCDTSPLQPAVRFIDCSANPDLLVHAKVGVRQDAQSAGPLLFTVG